MSEEHSADIDARRIVAANPRGIPSGPAAIHFCPVPGCLDLWESEATCEHAALIPEPERGCCSSCVGWGHTTYELCWDCRGTGCSHPEPLCVTPPEGTDDA